MAEILAACISHQGFVRNRNEDNILFDCKCMEKDHTGTNGVLTLHKRIGDEPIVFGLFDGMGGETRGEYASFIAADFLYETLVGKKADENALRAYFGKANDKVFEYAFENFGKLSGTTANIAILSEDSLICGNVGDSKTYLYRDDFLEQLSENDTDERLMEIHNIKNRKPVLTQYLGFDSEEMQIEPHMFTEKMKDGDVLLLCSDGVTDMVDLNEEKALFVSDPDVIASEIIEKVLANGGKDNATIIVIKYIQS